MITDDNNIYYSMDSYKAIRETDRIDKKMSEILILIDSLDDDVRKRINVEEIRNYIEEKMNDHDFRRQINIRNHMMSDVEEALCYLMDDFVTDREHIYLEDIEKEIILIEAKIRDVLAKIKKELTSDDIEI